MAHSSQGVYGGPEDGSFHSCGVCFYRKDPSSQCLTLIYSTNCAVHGQLAASTLSTATFFATQAQQPECPDDLRSAYQYAAERWSGNSIET